jgi:uncharacterized membrane protein
VTTRASQLWPVASAGLALAVLAVVVAELDSPLRPALVLPFLLLAPGMAVVRLLRIPDSAAVLMLAVALSLALAGLVAGTMVYTGTWSPVGGFVGLTLFTLAGNVADVVMFVRKKPAT